MDRPQIALVCRAAASRLPAARAFDAAPVEWEVTLHPDAPPAADVVVAVGEGVDGDVRFDPARPHLVVAEVDRALCERRRSIIAVIGASGGCGATSVALHLAAEKGAGTCFVDLHEGNPAAVRLGLDPAEVEDAAGPVPVAGGFRVAAAGGEEDPLRFRGDFQRVILDVPSQDRARAVDRCDAVVVVMMPTPTSAKQAVELLDDVGDLPVAVVTNRVGPGGETTQAELQRIIGCRIAVQLPCSRALRDSEDDFRLLTSVWSPWRRRIGRLSVALDRRLT